MTTSPHILWLRIAALVVLVVGAGACQTGITDASQIVFPVSNVSYGHDVQPLFDLSCAYSGCHNDVDQAGGLSLHSYVDLFRNPGIIRAGDSTGSVLWQVVTERLPHSSTAMSNLVTANQMHGIAVWIEEGAHNN